MKNQKAVTAAIIKKDDKILITQRKPTQSNPLFWEFVGGTIEYGEDPRDCLKREVKEELDIEVKVGKIFEVSSTINHLNFHIILLGFYCEFVSGKIQKIEINDYKWVTLDEMDSFKMAETDKYFVKALKKL